MNLMKLLAKTLWRSGLLTLTFLLCTYPALAGQNGAVLRGRVVDQLGAAIVGATVTATAPGGGEKTAVTDGEGVFHFSGLAPGTYTLRVSAEGFETFEDKAVEVTTRASELLTVRLSVESKREKIDVEASGATTPRVSVDPD